MIPSSLVQLQNDIAVVQQVMGHASMQVTLGYLRNLEVPVLRVEDMPF